MVLYYFVCATTVINKMVHGIVGVSTWAEPGYCIKRVSVMHVYSVCSSRAKLIYLAEYSTYNVVCEWCSDASDLFICALKEIDGCFPHESKHITDTCITETH